MNMEQLCELLSYLIVLILLLGSGRLVLVGVPVGRVHLVDGDRVLVMLNLLLLLLLLLRLAVVVEQIVGLLLLLLLLWGLVGSAVLVLGRLHFVGELVARTRVDAEKMHFRVKSCWTTLLLLKSRCPRNIRGPFTKLLLTWSQSA